MNAIGKNLPQVFGAYSTFLLYKGYQGPLLRVRRTEDDVEVDVFPDSTGKISLNSYVNANKATSQARNLGNFACAPGYTRDFAIGINVNVELRVTKVYNQGFNRSNDLVQTTPNSQPIIFISNTLKSNQLGPSIFFDNTSFQISNLPQNFTYHTCIKPLTSKNYTSTYFQNSTANIKGFSTFSTSTNIFSAKVAGALNRGVGIDNLYSYNKQQIEDKAYGDIQIDQTTAPLKERFLTFEFESDPTLYNTNDYTINPYGDVNFIVIYDDQTTPISRNNAIRRRETSQLLAEYNQDLFDKLNKFFPQSVLNKYPSPKFAFACKSLTGKFGGTLQPLIEVHRDGNTTNRVIVYADSKGEISLDSQVTVSNGVSNATTLGQFCAAPTYANPDSISEATIITYKLINQVDSIDSTDYSPVLITSGSNTTVLYNPSTKLQKIETYAPLFNSINSPSTFQMSINNGGTQSVIGVYESNSSIGALMANGPVAGSKNFRLEFGGKGPYYINTSATSYYVPAFGDYPTTLGNEVTLTSFVRSDSGRYVVRTNGKLFNVPGNQSADDLIECPYIGPIQGKLAAIIGYDYDISNFEEALSNELQLQFLIKKSQIKSLLNTYTDAAAAYSVRLLNKSTPYAVRVRRASDNTELNIGFTSVGQLDTTALTNFCTGTNCFVRTWYDQSTNANHATQTTTANQPKIYDSVTGVVLQNSVSAIDFDGTSQKLIPTSNINATTSNYEIFAVSNSNTDVNSWFFDAFSGRLLLDAQTTVVTGSGDAYYDGVNSSANKFTANVQSLKTWLLNATGNNSAAVYQNGALWAGSLPYTQRAIGGTMRIGDSSFDNRAWKGQLQELIFYAATASGNRAGIEQNINANYSIYWDGTQTGLLDTYPSAAAAYSVRALNSSYTGPILRVRRASDNTEQDIYALYNGELNVQALTTFCAGTNGFVRTWYDQSGNVRDYTMTTTANQWKVYDSSTGVVTYAGINGSAILGVSTSAYTQSINLANMHDGSGFTVVTVSAQGAGVGLGSFFGTTLRFFPIYSSVTYFDSPTRHFVSSISPVNGIIGFAFRSGSTKEAYQNGVQKISNTDATALPTTTVSFGINVDPGVYGFEFIWYPSDQSANRTGIETNINNAFTIYGQTPTGLLADYPGAAAAYSVRQLISTARYAMAVRRASDNAVLPIGFVNGNLDTTTLAAFCSGTNGFVAVWYDQSGNARDAVQTTMANQPKIYDSATGVLTEHGKPCAQFDGTNDSFEVSSTISATNGFIVAFVSQISATGAAEVALNVRGNSCASGNEIFYSSALNATYVNGRTSACGYQDRSGSAMKSLVVAAWNWASDTLNVEFDGVAASPNTSITETSTSINRIRLGVDSGSSFGDCKIQECVIWPSNSLTISNISDDINDYFNIY